MSDTSDLPPCSGRSRTRERFLTALLLVTWLVLAGRLVQLHLTSGEEFEDLASRQRTIREVVSARPGEIVDRHGRVFATSVAVRSLYLVPTRVRNPWRVAQQIADALDIDPDRLFERITSKPNAQFLWVKRRLSDLEADRIRDLKLPVEAWGFREEYRRSYPQGALAAHVIGLRNIDGVGQEGVELSFDHLLRGVDGYRNLIRDARGRVIEISDEFPHPPRHGETIALTIDAVIQVHVEKSLEQVMTDWKPHSACAVVMDPLSGEVLAMASRPTFDPNQPENISADAWKNRTISDIYEPGSTFKPFIVAWAMKHQCLQRDEVFNCENGEYRMGRRVLHDHHRYGNLNVVDILVKSSNIGMAKIGERLTNARLFDATLAFGFGMKTGIELPGEQSGMVRPLRKWNSYSTGSIPMGQEIAATPLQIIAAYAALCNGGRMVTPHLVSRTADASSHDPGVVVSQAIDADIADWIRCAALTPVVSRGTGKKAEIKGYEVFGKSGTAQKPDPQTGKYSNQLHTSSFVCGAPASNPRVLVLVSVDEPSVGEEHFGGSVAAPAAGQILRKTLQLLRVPMPTPPAEPTASATDVEAPAAVQ